MGQISKYGMVAAAMAAAGLATAADQGTDTLPTPQFFVEIVGPDTAGSTAQVVIPQSETKSARPATIKPVRSSNSRRYGPVAADDTLWSIAKGISANQPVSIYQTMLALYQHNPTAFKDSKISLLLDGSYLKVPSLTDIRAIDPETAAARFAALQRGETPSAKAPKRTVKPLPATPEPAAAVPANSAAKPQPQRERPELAKPEEVATVAAIASPPSSTETTAASESVALKAKDNNVATPELSLQQQQQLADLRALAEQLSGSAEQLTTMAEANHRLKLRLQELSEEVAALRTQLEADRASQAQLLASLQRQGADQPSGVQSPADLPAQLGNPLTLIGAGVVSVLSLLLGIMLWLRKRNRNNEELVPAEPSFSDREEMGPFDELLTVDTDDEQEALSSDEWKDGPAVSLDDSVADSDAAVDEALFSTAEGVVTGDEADQTGGNPDPAALLDGIDSPHVPQSDSNDPKSDIGTEGEEDADLSVAWEKMLADDDKPAEVDADKAPADETEDLSAAWDKLLVDDDNPAEVDADKAPADETEELSAAWEKMLSDDDDPAEVDADMAPADETEDLSAAWEKMLSDDGNPAEVDADKAPADESEELSAAWDKLLVDDADPADGADNADNKVAPAEPMDPAHEQDGLDWPEAPRVADEAPVTDARRGPAERDSASETEKQLRQSLSLEADVAAHKESTPGTLEQQFINKAPASEVDDLFAEFAKDAFTEREAEQEAEASGDEDSGFIDIDKLLAESDDDDKELEPYDEIHLNVGLDGFPEIMPTDTGGVDVDADGEVAAKLDLARAYMEIDDRESARMLIGEVLEEGDDKLKHEAQKLLKRLK